MQIKHDKEQTKAAILSAHLAAEAYNRAALAAAAATLAATVVTDCLIEYHASVYGLPLGAVDGSAPRAAALAVDAAILAYNKASEHAGDSSIMAYHAATAASALLLAQFNPTITTKGGTK